MRAPAAPLVVATLAGVAGGAAAYGLQEPRTLRVPEDARVVILGAAFAPGFPRSAELEPAGDVNGDGKPDLLVLNVQGHAGDETRSYLILGGRLPTTLRLDRLGRNGVELLRSRAGDRIDAAGDVNGDGRSDLVRCGHDPHVLLGSRSLRLTRGDTLPGGACGAAAGDVDGDGRDDLLLLRWVKDRQWAVVFGSRGRRRTLDLAALRRSGFRIAVGRFDDVEPLGDVNGDRRADLGVVRLDRGGASLRLVLGRRASGTLVVGGRRPIVGGAGSATFGPAGDVNGDGIGDLAVTEPNTRVCIVFGRRSWPATTGCTATRGLIVRGSDERYRVVSVEPAGDVDRDGHGDLLVGAPSVPRSDPEATGAVYLVYGRGDPGRVLLPADRRVVELTGGPKLGYDDLTNAAGAGDITADGRPDLVLGSGTSGDGWVLSP